jgi:hypothetical protein
MQRDDRLPAAGRSRDPRQLVPLPGGQPDPGFSFSLPLKFTEHQRDLGVELSGQFDQDDVDCMRARYYWPIFGRFLSPDRSSCPT